MLVGIREGAGECGKLRRITHAFAASELGRILKLSSTLTGFRMRPERFNLPLQFSLFGRLLRSRRPAGVIGSCLVRAWIGPGGAAQTARGGRAAPAQARMAE